MGPSGYLHRKFGVFLANSLRLCTKIMRNPDIAPIIAEFIEAQGLPSSFHKLAEQWYLPLSDEIAERVRQQHLRILGVSGSQGSGKSTLAAFLVSTLSHLHQLNCIALSMDDFYLTRAERSTLATTVHPLLMARGVPGTHDVSLFLQTIRALRDGNGNVAVPRFDKAVDDRKPPAEWDSIPAPTDLIILEGWCLKTPPQTDAALQSPINELEAAEDPQGIWRNYVNTQLQQSYQELFNQINLLIFMQAPSFDAVYRWRGLQEKKLISHLDQNAGPLQTMDSKKLSRFIQHFERLTLQNLKELPNSADIVFELDNDQEIIARH